MVRITDELISKSLRYVNAVKEYELQLRGQRIAVIENMGSAANYQAIDLIDNDIQYLGGFPFMKNLTMIQLSLNRISHIDTKVGESMPKLEWVGLEQNRLTELADLDPLGDVKNLRGMVLTGNEVTKKENYRWYVVWRCPNIRFLDSTKIKDVDRATAKELFGTKEEPTKLALDIMKKKTQGAPMAAARGPPSKIAKTSHEQTNRVGRMQLSEAERKKIEEMIRNAKSMDEIKQLEQDLSQGRLPAGVNIED